MITNAIQALGARSGSSRPAILKYILDNNKIADAENAGVGMKLAIRKMLAAKTLVPVKGSYKMSEQKTKPKKEDTKEEEINNKEASRKEENKEGSQEASRKEDSKEARKEASRKESKSLYQEVSK